MCTVNEEVKMDGNVSWQGEWQETDKDKRSAGFKTAREAFGCGVKPPGITFNLLDKYCAYACRAHADTLFCLRHQKKHAK